MGFVKYTLIFFVVSCFLVATILSVHNHLLVIVLSLLLGALELVYVLYLTYKILVSKYCWLIMSPFILLAFASGIIPGIVLVIVIYFARLITLSAKQQLENKS